MTDNPQNTPDDFSDDQDREKKQPMDEELEEMDLINEDGDSEDQELYESVSDFDKEAEEILQEIEQIEDPVDFEEEEDVSFLDEQNEEIDETMLEAFDEEEFEIDELFEIEIEEEEKPVAKEPIEQETSLDAQKEAKETSEQMVQQMNEESPLREPVLNEEEITEEEQAFIQNLEQLDVLESDYDIEDKEFEELEITDEIIHQVKSQKETSKQAEPSIEQTLSEKTEEGEEEVPEIPEEIYSQQTELKDQELKHLIDEVNTFGEHKEPATQDFHQEGISGYSKIIEDFIPVNFGADRYLVLIQNEENQLFTPLTSEGFHPSTLSSFSLSMDTPFIQPILKEQRVMYIYSDVLAFSPLRTIFIEEPPGAVAQLLLIPIIKEKQTKGILILARREGKEYYKEEQVMELFALSDLH